MVSSHMPFDDHRTMTASERRALAEALAGRPLGEFRTPRGVALLAALAADADPQVRQAVATLLDRLPEPAYAQLRAGLEHDANAYVVSAVRRAVARREKTTRRAVRTRFGVDRVALHLQRIEKRHGPLASRAAWRLCERYTQLLVASMVHDLRSILTHLKANALSLLAEPGTRLCRPGQVAARVRDDLEFLERTVLDMQQFTAPLDAARRPERLVDLLHAARQIALTSVRENGDVDPARIAFQLDVADRVTVLVARHMVVAALANILKNACESFAGGWPHTGTPLVEIYATVDGDAVHVVIRDNGMGFAQEEADALYLRTPGRRNKTKRNSTGYGLPNAARNIYALGGGISFESIEGRGTTVTVRLPHAMKGARP